MWKGPIQFSFQPGIANMKDLVGFKMVETFIQGKFPEGVPFSQNLQYFMISNNFGKLSGKLPFGIPDMPKLWYFDLRNHDLTGTIPSLPPRIQSFDVRQNKLSGDAPDVVGYEDLQVFSIIDNQIEKLGKFHDNPKLLKIEAQINKLQDFPSLKNLPRLNELRLYKNKIVAKIPASLGELTALQILDVHQNLMTSPVPAVGGELVNLQYVDISFNKFTDNCEKRLFFIFLPETIKNKTTGQNLRTCDGRLAAPLQHAIFNDNEINGDCNMRYDFFPNLLTFNGANNKLGGPALPSFFTPQGGPNFRPRITTIDVSGNNYENPIGEAQITGLSELAIFKVLGNKRLRGAEVEFTHPSNCSNPLLTCNRSPPGTPGSNMREGKEVIICNDKSDAIIQQETKGMMDSCAKIKESNFCAKAGPLCPVTCGSCPEDACSDLPSDQIQAETKGMMADCAKIKEANFCAKAGAMCRVTCDLCPKPGPVLDDSQCCTQDFPSGKCCRKLPKFLMQDLKNFESREGEPFQCPRLVGKDMQMLKTVQLEPEYYAWDQCQCERGMVGTPPNCRPPAEVLTEVSPQKLLQDEIGNVRLRKGSSIQWTLEPTPWTIETCTEEVDRATQFNCFDMPDGNCTDASQTQLCLRNASASMCPVTCGKCPTPGWISWEDEYPMWKSWAAENWWKKKRRLVHFTAENVKHVFTEEQLTREFVHCARMADDKCADWQNISTVKESMTIMYVGQYRTGPKKRVEEERVKSTMDLMSISRPFLDGMPTFATGIVAEAVTGHREEVTTIARKFGKGTDEVRYS
jgi:hypothetical protein